MNYRNKNFILLSFTAIVATIFIGFFFIYCNLLQVVLNFLPTYWDTGLQH